MYLLLNANHSSASAGEHFPGPAGRVWLRVLMMILTVAFTASLNAQSGSGTLSGRIGEAGSGRYLEGAIVNVVGTPFRDITDATGRYVITGLPAGQYEVNVSYVGLEPASGTVSITGSQSSTYSADLASLAGVESITVRASRTGADRAINQQRTADGIVNVISEEQFGQMIDANIGQALQRLPGLSVDQSQDGSQGSINIRGIAGEFNSVQIDGNRVPNSGGSNAFNPRQLAADGVTMIEVIKAPTPDRDGDAVGGIINLVSRSAFQRTGRDMSMNVRGSLNDRSDNWGYGANFDFSDIFSVGGGDDNLGISFSVSSYETDRFSINADQDWVQVDPASNPSLNLPTDFPVWFMESTHWEYDPAERTTNTFSGSLDFRINENNSFYFRPLISFEETTSIPLETDIDIDTEFENDADGNKTYAELTPNYGRGTADSEASRGWIGTLEDDENELYSLTVGGEHELSNSFLAYDVSYSSNERTINDDSELNMLMEPDDPWFIFEYEVFDPRGDIRVDVVNGIDSTDLGLMTEGELEKVFGTRDEQVFNAKLDWERYFRVGSGTFEFKTGAKYRQSSQSNDITVDLYETDEDFPYDQVTVPTDEVLLLKPKFFDVQPQAGLSLLASNPELFEFVEDDSLEDSNVEDFDAEETISAGYLMGTYEVGIHRIIGGVRFERYEWENTNKFVSYLGDVPSVNLRNNGDSHSFVLPGLHFRHELTENLILRESFNRSYARPRLEELSRGRWEDDDGNIEDGNPNLKPGEADNYDIQLEYYTDTGGLYSVAFFRKDIENFSFTEAYDFNEFDANGIPIPAENGDFEYERPVNGTNASNQGVELIARQNLFFLPGALRGLSLSVSATFTESDADYPDRTDRELPLEGFSEELWTATIDYNWNNFSARLDYRYRDDYIEGLGDDIESDEFFAAEYRIDGELHYLINDNLRISGTVVNLTDQGQISYQGFSAFVEDASFAGRKFTVGMQYDF